MCAAPKAAAKSKDCPAEKYRRKRWVKAFEACDENNKGYLNREDYKVAIVMLFGYKPSKVEVDSVMASVKQNPFDFKKAFSIVVPKLPERIIVEAFREVDQDSDGHISFNEFESAMNYGQENLSHLT
ncbi:EF-hand calcium-binding domain-containing protein 11 isoform 6-T6 [Liasis olivaceus]